MQRPCRMPPPPASTTAVAFERYPGAALPSAASLDGFRYERRQPERTPLYKLVARRFGAVDQDDIVTNPTDGDHDDGQASEQDQAMLSALATAIQPPAGTSSRSSQMKGSSQGPGSTVDASGVAEFAPASLRSPDPEPQVARVTRSAHG